MERRAIHESLAFLTGLIVAVEKPLISGHANLKQHAVVSIGAGPRILLAQVKPALLAFTAIGPEDRLEGKRLRAGKRIESDVSPVSDHVMYDKQVRVAPAPG